MYRQPALLMSLVGGPALALALFGVSFRSPNPTLRAVLVWPAEGIPGLDRELVIKVIDRNMDVTAVVSDPDEALRLLAENKADVVHMIPAGMLESLESGEIPKIGIVSETIDPNVELWIRSLTYVNTTYLNQRILLDRTKRSQEEARQVQAELQQAQETLGRLEPNIDPERRSHAMDALNTLQSLVPIPLAYLPRPGEVEGELGVRAQELRVELTGLLDDLNELEKVLQSGQIEAEIERIRRIDERARRLRGTIDAYAGLDPERIVIPVQSDYTNLRGKPYRMVVFYVPGVLALLIQHLGVALGALAIVREQAAGAFELFYVAPVNALHLLLGKTLAYTAYVLLAAGALFALLPLLDVPSLGSPGMTLLFAGLLALASIGVGMVISAYVSSDTQAIQLTMILLLFSIFFSGFFVPLSGFSQLSKPVSDALPMTHGLAGLQALMLLGRSPDAEVWQRLGVIAIVAYALAFVAVRHKFRNRKD